MNPAWNLTASEAVALEFVKWLETEGARWENFVDETGHDAERAWQTAEHAGWVQTVRRPGRRKMAESVVLDPKVTGAGRGRLEQVEIVRANRAARAAACRQGLLLWIYSARPSETGSFVSDAPYQFYGTPFTEDEVGDAVQYLRERKLITGIVTWGRDILRPDLTAAGVDAVENHGGDLRAEATARESRGGNTYNFPVSIGGSGNAVNVGGANNHATVYTASSAGEQEIEAVLTALRNLAGEVGGAQGAALETAAATLENTPREDKSAVRGVLTMAAAIIAGVSRSVVGAAEAVEAVTGAIQAIGH